MGGKSIGAGMMGCAWIHCCARAVVECWVSGIFMVKSCRYCG